MPPGPRERRLRKDLAERMRSARIATWGPIQERCAEALHVSQSQISRWERGQEPRPSDLLRFAQGCNVTVGYLLGEDRRVAVAEQLLLGLDAESAGVVVDLVRILKRKPSRAS